MKTLLVLAALSAPAALFAQVRVQSAPGAFAYVVGDPDRAVIGVSTRTTGKRDTLGLMVESVTRGGPAEQAGIEEGDRLVSVNGINLRLSPSDAGESDMDGVATRRLVRELEKQKAGGEVELRVYRDGSTRTARVKTVTADELNNNSTGDLTSTTRSFRSAARDRAVLGLSLGGNGSRRDTLGILVVGITDEGPAAKAGIEEGDRVVSINGVDLRVAAEDAGDSQASSARINRLNREMEKVKAGDAVELRVYSSGQTRTLRVEAAKASDLGDGFFFNNGSGRMITVPRAVRVRPPEIEFDDFPARARAKIDLENNLRSLQGALRQSLEPTLRLREQLRSELPRKITLRSSTSL
jgi:predicted metalloprotease with PDZ domain